MLLYIQRTIKLPEDVSVCFLHLIQFYCCFTVYNNAQCHVGLVIFSGRGKLFVWGYIQSPHPLTANFAFTFLNRKNNRFQTLLLCIHIKVILFHLLGDQTLKGFFDGDSCIIIITSPICPPRKSLQQFHYYVQFYTILIIITNQDHSKFEPKLYSIINERNPSSTYTYSPCIRMQGRII